MSDTPRTDAESKLCTSLPRDYNRMVLFARTLEKEVAELKAQLHQCDVDKTMFGAGMDQLIIERDRLKAEVEEVKKQFKLLEEIADSYKNMIYDAVPAVDGIANARQRLQFLIKERDRLRAEVARLQKERDEAVEILKYVNENHHEGEGEFDGKIRNYLRSL